MKTAVDQDKPGTGLTDKKGLFKTEHDQNQPKFTILKDVSKVDAGKLMLCTSAEGESPASQQNGFRLVSSEFQEISFRAVVYTFSLPKNF